MLERVEGSDPDDARTRPFVYGTVIGPGWIEDAIEPLGIFEESDDEREAPDPTSIDLDGVTVVGPAGPIALSNADHELLDLRAGWMTDGDVETPRFTVLARAYLTKRPDVAFREPVELGELLGLTRDQWEVIVVAGSMQHVVGSEAPAAPYDDASLRTLPSQTPSYQSLARALIRRNRGEFAPGADNLDFRAHAKIPVVESS